MRVAASRKRKRSGTKKDPSSKPVAVKKASVKKDSPRVKRGSVKKNPDRKARVKKNPGHAPRKTGAKPPARKRASAVRRTRTKSATPLRRPAKGVVLGGFARVPVKDLRGVLRNYEKVVLAKLAKQQAKVAALQAKLAEQRGESAERLAEKKRLRAERGERLRTIAEQRIVELEAKLAARDEALATEKKKVVRLERIERLLAKDTLRRLEEQEVRAQVSELEFFLAQDRSSSGREAYKEYQIRRAQETADRLTEEKGERVPLEEVLYAIAKEFGVQARDVFTAWHSPSLSYAA
jgi:hypothetical protein